MYVDALGTDKVQYIDEDGTLDQSVLSLIISLANPHKPPPKAIVQDKHLRVLTKKKSITSVDCNEILSFAEFTESKELEESRKPKHKKLRVAAEEPKYKMKLRSSNK